MINNTMKQYNYKAFGNEMNSYGQPTLSETEGTVKMAINFVTEAIDSNSLYSGAQYTGLTFDTNVDSSYVIEYGDENLKVLYVNPAGRYKQVFMARM